MFLLVFVLLGILLGVARGGSLIAALEVNIRWPGLIFAALLLQIVAFSSLGDNLSEPVMAATHILSYILLAICLVRNLKLAGMPFLAAGLVCNLTAIAVNGGRMPALQGHLEKIGVVTEEALNNSAIIDADTPLWWLGDVFYLPVPVLANVFSVGDIFIGLGAAFFCYRAMLHR